MKLNRKQLNIINEALQGMKGRLSESDRIKKLDDLIKLIESQIDANE